MEIIPSLESELRQALSGEVDFGDGARAAYAYDASNYRQIPIGVVIPKTIDDVIQTAALCRKYGAPILSRGAATSLAGQCCNEAVIIDFSKYLNKILEIDPVKKIARVQPGVILDDLCRETVKYGLTFGPDPATHSRCTLGGMIGNNSCGVHSVMSGKTAENTVALEILTYEGVRLKVGATPEAELDRNIQKKDAAAEIYLKLKTIRDKYADLIRENFPKLPRRVSGYNLNELLPENQFHVARALVGTEGTCVIILEATLQLVEAPAFRSLVAAGYPSIEEAADDVPHVLTYKPVGLEGLDRVFVRNMKKAGLHLKEIADLPAGEGWLLVEFGGKTQEEADQYAKKFLDRRSSVQASADVDRWFRDPKEQKRIWSLRESSFGASVFVPGEKDTFSGFEDSAVPPDKLGAYLRQLGKLYERYGYSAITYGHFGDGCIHTRISFDLKSETGIQTYKRFLEDAADLVVKFGGSFSGEHGDGQTWGHLLHKMYGHELVQAFREFKAVWDPRNKMNPGKVVDTYGVDQNLRQREYAKMNQGHLQFSFSEDGRDFSRSTERCIGIGKCVAPEGGVMCPSYRATHDEKHSTRGRAHLLHEMMRGEVIQDGWKSEAVKEALDECLACKACKNECPVKVDMASYKAEFLSHYYAGRRRPLSAYLFGFIAAGARMASKFPRMFNFVIQFPGLNPLFKKIAGIAAARQLPEVASQTFREWFLRRAVSEEPKALQPAELKETVILWPDTFSNFFHPEIAQAAVEVLEFSGFRVKLPPENLCCGRPLYDQGMLALAKEYLQEIMKALEEDLQKGALIVGLEPSCVSVFQDELMNFFPEDPLAEKLSRQSFLLADFLEKKAPQTDWPKLTKKAVVQRHCHPQALSSEDSDKKIYDRLGLDYRILDAGCCGMAGSFGFEARHYDLSVKIAGQSLLPELKRISEDTLVLTDGFSCREQVRQLSGRRALHLAEVLKMSLDGRTKKQLKRKTEDV